MCEIGGVDVGGSVSTVTTIFPLTLLPSALGPVSTVPSTPTSERRYEFLWLTSPPSMSASFPILPSLLPDLPYRLRSRPGSLSFNLLNDFERDSRRSMSVLDRCRSRCVSQADELVVSIQDRPTSSAQKVFCIARGRGPSSDCHPLLFMGGHPSCNITDLCRIGIHFCLSIQPVDYLSITIPNANDFRWTPGWPHRS